MTVIERAEQRMEEEERNNGCVSYWSAYLDGARAQKKEESIVRCKDCKYFVPTKGYCFGWDGHCVITEDLLEDDDYCSKGARR